MTDELKHLPEKTDDHAVPTHAPAPGDATSAENKQNEQIVNHRNPWDSLVAKARAGTPAWVVNSSSQFNLGLKGAADGMSIWSSVRKGSQSPSRLVASLITLFTEVCGLFFKEKAPSDQQEREYAQMSMPQYAVTKTIEGFNPKDHILESNGVATILNGAFTTLSGIRQSSKRTLSAEIWQGALTSLAGMFMVYMPERQRAWQISHGIFMWRVPFATAQAWTAYTKGYPDKGIAKGDWQQGAKLVLNQSSNVFALFYGGVKKMDDGRIVLLGKDSTEDVPEKMRMREKLHVAKRSGEKTPHDGLKPATTVSNRMAIDRVQQPETAQEVTA